MKFDLILGRISCNAMHFLILFFKRLIWLRELGLLNHWVNSFLPRPYRCSSPLSSLRPTSNEKLTLNYLSSAFLLYGVGVGISILAFLLELIFSLWSTSQVIRATPFYNQPMGSCAQNRTRSQPSYATRLAVQGFLALEATLVSERVLLGNCVCLSMRRRDYFEYNENYFQTLSCPWLLSQLDDVTPEIKIVYSYVTVVCSTFDRKLWLN